MLLRVLRGAYIRYYFDSFLGQLLLFHHEGHEVHEGLQYHSFDSMLQEPDVEIYQQPDAYTRQFHVCQ